MRIDMLWLLSIRISFSTQFTSGYIVSTIVSSTTRFKDALTSGPSDFVSYRASLRTIHIAPSPY